MKDNDALDALRAEDPIGSDPSLTPSLNRVRAELVPAGLTRPTDVGGSWLRPALTAAAPLAAAGILGAMTLVHPFSSPTEQLASPAAVAVVSPTAHAGDLTSCAYNPVGSLMERDYVFDGTVLKVTGVQVAFRVNEWFRGSGGNTVTMTVTPGHGGSQLMDEGSPAMQVGERWLVAGDAGFIWGCGFTHRYMTP